MTSNRSLGFVHRTTVLALALAATSIGAGARTAHAHGHDHDNDGFEIAAPGSRPLGRSYSEWAARWWQWAMRIPAAHNPMVDLTGADCARGQKGKVFFLAGVWGLSGGPVTRTCDVPKGKALLFPIYNWIWEIFKTDIDPDTGKPYTLDVIRAWLKGAVEQDVKMTLEIDGVVVKDPLKYREFSPLFTVRLPKDNLPGVTAAQCDVGRKGLFECESLDGGYYFFVKGLGVGEHTIHFTASDPWGDVEDLTYTLRISDDKGHDDDDDEDE